MENRKTIGLGLLAVLLVLMTGMANASPTATLMFANVTGYDTGQTLTLGARIGGGTSPFTYNFLIYNSMGGLVTSIVANNALAGNVVTYVLPSSLSGNSIFASVTVTDSANAVASSPQYGGSFGTANSFITLSSPSALPSGSITISTWVYLNALSTDDGTFYSANTQSITNGYSWLFTDPSGHVRAQYSNGIAEVPLQATGTIAAGKWYMISQEFDIPNNAYAFYINGVQSGSGSISNFVQSGRTNGYIGTYQHSTSTQYGVNGYLSNFQLYNTALNATQITALYNEGIGGAPVLPSNDVLWMPLNGNANDLRGNGNNGIATNVIFANLPLIPVSKTLTANALLVSNTIADLGQFETLVANIIGGTPPYQYSIKISNSINANVIASSLGYNSLLATNSLTAQLVGVNALGTLNTNSIAADSSGLPQEVAVFNGKNSSIQTPTMPAYTQLTVVAWVDVYRGGSTAYGGLAGPWECGPIWNTPAGSTFDVQWDTCRCAGVTTCLRYATLSGLPTNQWLMLAYTTDGNGNVKSYGYTPSQFYTGATSGNAFTIPSIYWLLGQYEGGSGLNGMLANVQIYNTSLSATQVARLYAEGIGGSPILPSNIIAWWQLNGAAGFSGANVLDSSGNGNSGTPTAVVYATNAMNTGYSLATNAVSSNTMTVNTALVSTAISSPLAPNTLDVGQSLKISVTAPTTGSSPYSYSWSVGGTSCPNFVNPATASFTYTPTATSPNCAFTAVVTDFATTPEYYSITTNTIQVNVNPSAGIVPASASYDSGQTMTLTAIPSGGTLPYTYQWYNYTSGNGVLMGGQTANVLSITSGVAQTVSYFVGVTDAVAVSANSAAGTYVINGALVAGTPTASNSLIDAGQYSRMSPVTSGGTPGYSYRWYTGVGCTNQVGSGSTYLTQPSSTTTYYYQVTDSAYSPNTACSAIGVTVTVNPVPSTATASLAIIFSSAWSGGIAPFTANLLSSLGLPCNQSSTLVERLVTGTNSVTFNSITVTQSKYFCIYVTDASPSPITINSTTTFIQIGGPPSWPIATPPASSPYGISLGVLFFSISFAIFIIRINRTEEANYYWVISYFLSLCFIWFGFYFTVFPFQNAIQTTSTYNAISNTLLQIQNTTTQYPVVAVNTYQFWFILTITAMWSLFVIIMGVYEFIIIGKAETEGKRPMV